MHFRVIALLLCAAIASASAVIPITDFSSFGGFLPFTNDTSLHDWEACADDGTPGNYTLLLHELDKRDRKKEKLPTRKPIHHDRYTCGNFASGDPAIPFEEALLAKKDPKELARVGPQTCIRTRCKKTTGIYLCNRSNKEFVIEHPFVVIAARMVMMKCSDFWRRYWSSGSYELRSRIDVIFAYANCNHSRHRGPFYKIPGPNGGAWLEARQGYPEPDEAYVPKNMVDDRWSEASPQE